MTHTAAPRGGKRGETPVVKDSGGRFGFKLISAVSPKGDMRFHFIKKRMDSELFIQFLQKLRTDANRPILVIADNARYHHRKKAQAFLKKNEGSIMVAFLPAYSPELNPDEQVWNHAKLQLGKRAIKSDGEMKKHLSSIMKSIQKRKELIKSFSACLIPNILIRRTPDSASTYATINTQKCKRGFGYYSRN